MGQLHLGTKILATGNIWDISLTFAIAAGPLYGFLSLTFIMLYEMFHTVLNCTPWSWGWG